MQVAIPATEQDICAACDLAISLSPVTYPPTLPSSQQLSGAPEWYPFEHEVWPIGEKIRLAFVKDRSLRRHSAFAKVAKVVGYPNLRRGRQSFVMALEFPEACQFAPVIAQLVTDPDVDGQVVHTLLKMKAGGYRELIEPLLHSDKTWIRRLAKRYVERF